MAVKYPFLVRLITNMKYKNHDVGQNLKVILIEERLYYIKAIKKLFLISEFGSLRYPSTWFLTLRVNLGWEDGSIFVQILEKIFLLEIWENLSFS